MIQLLRGGLDMLYSTDGPKHRKKSSWHDGGMPGRYFDRSCAEVKARGILKCTECDKPFCDIADSDSLN